MVLNIFERNEIFLREESKGMSRRSLIVERVTGSGQLNLTPEIGFKALF